MTTNVVIIGAGQAGVTAALSLRDQGWDQEIHIIGAEDHVPYQRPPLSKGYLAGTEDISDLALCSTAALDNQQITTHFGVAVTQLHREQKVVVLDNGKRLQYRWLIIATGSEPRDLMVPGNELSGLHSVRTVEDADALRECFTNGGHTVFIGGGFLNLEVAAEAARHGSVTVLEVAPQILGRVLSRPAAEALAKHHQQLGVDIRCGTSIRAILGEKNKVVAVELEDGERIATARVVVSVGATARDELAAQAGLVTDAGIIVDEQLRTSDDSIFAIGDCAVYPSVYAGSTMRVESVQNATDQARHVASVITTGSLEDYRAVPWFWSIQGTQRLQIAGLALPDDDTRVVQHDEATGKLVVERMRDDRLVAVETINAPGPHMKARKTLAASVAQLVSQVAN